MPKKMGFINLTREVEKYVLKSKIQRGSCLVNAMHITASVFINDAESGLLHDFGVWLEHLPLASRQTTITIIRRVRIMLTHI